MLVLFKEDKEAEDKWVEKVLLQIINKYLWIIDGACWECKSTVIMLYTEGPEHILPPHTNLLFYKTKVNRKNKAILFIPG